MADFTRQDLTGSRFEQVDLSGARFHNVYLTGATIRGAVLVNVEIDGLIQDVRVNGVDVVPLVEAELKGYPEPESYPVRRCLQAILTEEWEHRLFAERDLDLLTSRPPG